MKKILERIIFLQGFWQGALGIVMTILLIGILSGIEDIFALGLLLGLAVILHILIIGGIMIVKK